MSPWDASAAAIAAAFADPAPLVFNLGGIDLAPISAVRCDDTAPSFEPNRAPTNRVTYEVRRDALPERPIARADSFTHRGRRWRIENVRDLDAVDAWELTVGDDGATA